MKGDGRGTRKEREKEIKGEEASVIELTIIEGRSFNVAGRKEASLSVPRSPHPNLLPAT